MDAILTAGGIPQPEDPLYTYTNGDSKALLDMAGKPMIQWVLDALSDAKHVDNVIVIGLSPKSECHLQETAALHLQPGTHAGEHRCRGEQIRRTRSQG